MLRLWQGRTGSGVTPIPELVAKSEQMDSGRDEGVQDDPRDDGDHPEGGRARPRTRSRSLTEEQALGQSDLDVEGQAHAVSQSDTNTAGVASARSRLAVRLHEAAGEVHGHRPAPDASTSSSEAAEAPQGGDGLVDCARYARGTSLHLSHVGLVVVRGLSKGNPLRLRPRKRLNRRSDSVDKCEPQ